MDLQSGMPYSLIQNGLLYNYPKLENSLETEVVILGSGISGALSAYYLSKAGIDCVVIDATEYRNGKFLRQHLLITIRN